MTNLNTSYLGIEMKNPLIAASSGLTSTVSKIKKLEEAGVGAIVIKSIFEEQINNEVIHMMAQSDQNSYPEAEDYIRAYTRENEVNQHLELVKEAKQQTDIPIIASVNCMTSNEWTSFAKNFEEAGADALELNVFNIPTDKNQTVDRVEQVYTDIVSKVAQTINIPVALKMSFYHTNIVAMISNVYAAGAKGVVLFNRFYEPDINLDKLEITASNVFSNADDMRTSLRWVGLVSSMVPNINIAASTGVHNSDGAIKQLLAGANATQICSTLYVNGLGVVQEILTGIEQFMNKWNFNSIDEFRGRLSYKNISDPVMYERSQFMKYYSNKK